MKGKRQPHLLCPPVCSIDNARPGPSRSASVAIALSDYINAYTSTNSNTHIASYIQTPVTTPNPPSIGPIVRNNSSHSVNSRRRRHHQTRDTDAIDEAAEPDGDEASESALSALNVLADVAAPSTAIDSCFPDGFQLGNGMTVTDGDGCLLVDGEVFRWRPWEAGKNDGDSGGGSKDGMRAMINEKGQWEVSEEVWGVLKLVWPKPDLLILGLGASVYPISPETRRQINLLGIRIEVQDTRNAAAQFNLLATERGVQEVAEALIPLG
ncbi:conserved hypothetical protein [Histoplasma mississippiense (nom. inval.)]|uniref:conserved hypothetical protein n=1 Tax=Ajellomyces capsulatus (strain NAm1 / WU24) TaxID=2059318 RepID=UPI000157C55B|nr:conserved hypothetical protein [Histoplasma mississippiense (nom. inval.)]EDN08040.1 conserved hypothetical protein [Histoplasma mississippiense (nom. inval.)]